MFLRSSIKDVFEEIKSKLDRITGISYDFRDIISDADSISMEISENKFEIKITKDGRTTGFTESIAKE